MVRVRSGFSLVEAIVALTLLTVGLLGAVATQSLAARLLREAEARGGAVDLAGAILDSLLVVAAPTDGEREEGTFRARWQLLRLGGDVLGDEVPDDDVPGNEVRGAEAKLIELEVQYHDGAEPRRLYFELLHLAPLPRIGARG